MRRLGSARRFGREARGMSTFPGIRDILAVFRSTVSCTALVSKEETLWV